MARSPFSVFKGEPATAMGALVIALHVVVPVWAGASPAAGTNDPARPPIATQASALSNDAAWLLERIIETKDNAGRSFALVDKKHARVHVFDPNGTLRGSSAVLLGAAKGDDSVPGIGERPLSQIRPSERTTPAGRFQAEAGVNAQGEDIVWVDYDAAVSMHRVRASNKAERRLERLATPTISDNRISYGCINVPAAFYDQYLHMTLGREGGVVYVLPEVRTLQAQFGALGRDSSR